MFLSFCFGKKVADDFMAEILTMLVFSHFSSDTFGTHQVWYQVFQTVMDSLKILLLNLISNYLKITCKGIHYLVKLKAYNFTKNELLHRYFTKIVTTDTSDNFAKLLFLTEHLYWPLVKFQWLIHILQPNKGIIYLMQIKNNAKW